MRLGSYPCVVTPGTILEKAYGARNIEERHRHRYEFNNEFTEDFRRAGLLFAGWNPRRGLAEIIELPTHRWFVGVQFHPEFKSRPDNAHPLFKGFVAASLKK